VKRVKSIYKDLTSSALSVKEVKNGDSDSLEILNYNLHNARANRTACFRRKVIFEIG